MRTPAPTERCSIFFCTRCSSSVIVRFLCVLQVRLYLADSTQNEILILRDGELQTREKDRRRAIDTINQWKHKHKHSGQFLVCYISSCCFERQK